MNKDSIGDGSIVSVRETLAEGSAFLFQQRLAAVMAPRYSLRHLSKHDDRLAAHVDGLRVAGDAGWTASQAQMGTEDPGAVFAAALLALESGNAQRIESLFALSEAVPAMQPGLISAFGWISAQFLESTTQELLASSSPFRRRVGIACCAMHRVDPGPSLIAACNDPDAPLRARALRAAGELRRRDLLPVCHQHLADEDPASGFWAAWSAVLLGDRGQALSVLKSFALFPGPFRESALQLVLKTLEMKDAHALLQSFAQDPTNLRLLIQGSGVAGDPAYVAWLISHMADNKMARLAGESFSFITGLDLAYLDLDRKPPEDFESGPNDDPNDDNVEMDPDDNLPWPDPVKIQSWWGTNRPRFTDGVRHFMGEPVSVAKCRQVLRDGFQRQRIAAALYLCVLQPGTQLFPTSAPAWRQQRWLTQLA